MPDLFNHPIIYLRRLRTPTCKTCANYSVRFLQPPRACAKYLEHYNRLNCASVEYAILDDVRGTRFCEYEQRKANQQSGGGDE